MVTRQYLNGVYTKLLRSRPSARLTLDWQLSAIYLVWKLKDDAHKQEILTYFLKDTFEAKAILIDYCSRRNVHELNQIKCFDAGW